MSNKEQIKLMKEVREIIDELGGIDETIFLSIGVNATECLNPTEKTLEELKKYQAKVNKEKIERLDISL
ncbi:MAG: hypothetical protein PHH51_02390 [Bacilli bacterium]|nr:hypothetical protein [Bacilli bacterium]